MTKRFSVSLIIGFALLILNGGAIESPASKSRMFVSNFENVLGTSMEIKFQAMNGKDAEIAENKTLEEIDRLSKILSAYDKESEFSIWIKSRNAQVKVSSELFEVLSLFDKWKLLTNGALDASAETVSRVWKEAVLKQELPSDLSLSLAVEKVKQKHWSLDYNNKTATHLDDSPLILNSFVKSYIINKAADAALKEQNISAVVINIGGDIVVKGALNETVQISDPNASAENDMPLSKLMIQNRAVATSGNYKRGFQIGNTWYSHIVDPRTGKPAGNIISATVVAPNASDAGALATALNVLDPEEGLKLASSIPNVEMMLITKDGKRLETKGWQALELPLDQARSSALETINSAQPKWNPNFELAINLEINTISGYRSRRPFVAVWVEDENKKLVRNIAVWFDKDRYLNELRSWARVTNGFANTNFSSISSATRSPGAYSLKWDGKDDNGSFVKAGKYTVVIEAAREHGTHQLMSQEINFNATAAQFKLPGNVEIASVAFDYKKESSTK
jgi:FAD:protein FMN transferase